MICVIGVLAWVLGAVIMILCCLANAKKLPPVEENEDNERE